jgi:hypothetical protein
LSGADERSLALVYNSDLLTGKTAADSCDFGCYFLARMEPDLYGRAFLVTHRFGPTA